MMKISLVMATIGRIREIEEFILSLLSQDYDKSCIQLIIVDQNEEDFISDIVSKFKNILDVLHVRSSQPGLSHNRNLGIGFVTGDIVAFPDDDCRYYPNTISNVINLFQSNPGVDIFLGRITNSGQNIIKKWKSHELAIDYINLIHHQSSITIFSRRTSLTFDERLGAGTKFGAAEDADFLFRALESGKIIRYTPIIEVWHPEPGIIANDKVKLYGMGFGAMCRKMRLPATKIILIESIGYHTIKLLLACALLDRNEIARRYLSISSRISGYFNWETH